MASRSVLRKSNRGKSLILAKIRIGKTETANSEAIFKTASVRGLQTLTQTIKNNEGAEGSSTQEKISLLAAAALFTVASVPFISDYNTPPGKNGLFERNNNRLRTACEAQGWGPTLSPHTSRSPRLSRPPPTLNSVQLKPKEKRGAKNIMLQRMRSLRARDMMDKYTVDWKTVLGEGAYGSVYPARLTSTNEKVALKKISKRFTNSTSFRTETDALHRVFENGGHPNISGLRDIYEDFGHFYLILDLVSGGEMFDNLINFGAYSEADAARLMMEVSSALAFLHGVGVVHADLKPENLLLDDTKRSNGYIKIIDFGCALVEQDIFHDYDPEDADYDDEEMRPKGVAKKAAGSADPAASTGTTACKT